MIKEKLSIPLNDDLLFKEAFSNKANRKQLIYFLKSITHLKEEVIKKDLEVKYESILDKTKYNDKSLREM